MKADKNTQHIRKLIDNVDSKIINLIRKRIFLSQKIIENKINSHKSVRCKLREEEILRNYLTGLNDLASDQQVKTLFKAVLKSNSLYNEPKRSAHVKSRKSK